MEREVLFDKMEAKKHSVCYKTSQENPAVTSIYVMKGSLPQPYPKKIRIKIIFDEK